MIQIQIGDFIAEVETTKDTVRHYETLGLLSPKWENGRRIYTVKDVEDFQVIKEMQAFGLALKDIQAIFESKQKDGCGSEPLIKSVKAKLKEKLATLMEEKAVINQKVAGVKQTLKALKDLT